jgi:hypothetical protein
LHLKLKTFLNRLLSHSNYWCKPNRNVSRYLVITLIYAFESLISNNYNDNLNSCDCRQSGTLCYYELQSTVRLAGNWKN